MLTQGESVEVVEEGTERKVKVLTQSDNQFATLLPLLLLMGGTGTEPGKGGLDTNMLMLFALLGRK